MNLYNLSNQDVQFNLELRIEALNVQIDKYIAKPLAEHDVRHFCKLCTERNILRKRLNDAKAEVAPYTLTHIF